MPVLRTMERGDVVIRLRREVRCVVKKVSQSDL